MLPLSYILFCVLPESLRPDMTLLSLYSLSYSLETSMVMILATLCVIKNLNNIYKASNQMTELTCGSRFDLLSFNTYY